MRFFMSFMARRGRMVAAAAVLALAIGAARGARADLLAAYVQGHGGLSSVQVDGVAGPRPGNVHPGKRRCRQSQKL